LFIYSYLFFHIFLSVFSHTCSYINLLSNLKWKLFKGIYKKPRLKFKYSSVHRFCMLFLAEILSTFSDIPSKLDSISFFLIGCSLLSALLGDCLNKAMSSRTDYSHLPDFRHWGYLRAGSRSRLVRIDFYIGWKYGNALRTIFNWDSIFKRGYRLGRPERFTF